ncbi:BlaI/MecI/CopY family transcriptional regulator [Nesterenkonia sp. LB17]|uniref:BlaI/MecI/CopY family transcriptional regulator n=1 Tax=unclassified Nesterenkonia TaxID=2629769 RepID=UPI001F4CAA7F|nr:MULTISPECIES: BlaI/MecI/CopY family transcriptional regulator [unclassified Nesterenkonia]MCH8559185.1 BlaI/MecI/CopY family transcriptional regulator [Nesterenkonia sp. DZ6]MCH8563098.1 BlaI/MecI/CopY family transcriptional regulator [Nesterenkonia sp. YGD6]MCH8565086.1 BlaI/MecI/CopY family transcriptional regulator [Nesterenkonia sp. LB17]MCH8571532.1 BlaI/MecI/CopY family transcriptional regulator [Nesterenkonia sp. AY15]
MSEERPPGTPAERLGPLEQQVMDLLWDHSGHTVREVMDQLPSRPAYTTIATVMGNLERKALVAPTRVGRSVRYLPQRTREEHTAGLMRHALGVSRDRTASILHFVDTMPDEERDLLRAYLAGENSQDSP